MLGQVRSRSQSRQGRKNRCGVRTSVVPSGTFRYATASPSAKALGYCRSSLRDGQWPARSTTFSRPSASRAVPSSGRCYPGRPRRYVSAYAPLPGSKRGRGCPKGGRGGRGRRAFVSVAERCGWGLAHTRYRRIQSPYEVSVRRALCLNRSTSRHCSRNRTFGLGMKWAGGVPVRGSKAHSRQAKSWLAKAALTSLNPAQMHPVKPNPVGRPNSGLAEDLLGLSHENPYLHFLLTPLNCQHPGG